MQAEALEGFHSSEKDKCFENLFEYLLANLLSLYTDKIDSELADEYFCF